MNRLLFSLSTAGWLVLVSLTASATVLPSQNLKQLLESADAVFQGRVSRTTVEVDRDGIPWTLYAFDGVQTIVGLDVGPTFALRCMGGEVDGMVTEVQGTPSFSVGAEVVIFFRERNDICQVAGWTQGVFHLVQDNGTEILLNYNGRPVVGLTEDDLVTAAKPEWWTVEGPGGLLLVDDRGSALAADHDSAESALPAEAVVVKDEIRALAASLRRTWPIARPTTRAVGRAGVLNTPAVQQSSVAP